MDTVHQEKQDGEEGVGISFIHVLERTRTLYVYSYKTRQIEQNLDLPIKLRKTR